MNQNEKFKLNKETVNRRWLLRLRMGCGAVCKDGRKAGILAIYLITAVLLWLFREQVFNFDGADMLASLYRGIAGLFIPIYGVGGLFFLLAAMGTPFRGGSVSNDLRRAGLVNHAGEAPLLASRKKDKQNPRVTVLEFEAAGIPVSEWEDKRAKIETALNIHVVKISEGRNKRRILLHTVPAGNALPGLLRWKDAYLNPESFTLVLGESLLGPVTVNLAHIPHILLGGSTGSGKSILLKLLLMQCLKKNAVVCVADFKGGVDFPAIWHKQCRMCFEETDLLDLLTGLVDELQRRKEVFRETGCANLDEYNRATGTGLQRILFACDEVAEVLDKNGLSKEAKELVAKIENKLSIIARQGRAFGIHLILATQRPDATILSGQIRNNIDCRVCGRADNVLSQIILDSTAASDLIPKDARGRFLLHDGTVFQGYLFDEQNWT